MRRDVLDKKYEILEILEEDGQQAAYKAKHRVLGELCALRVRPHRLDEPELRADFEARLPWFTRVKHERIVTVFDVTIDGHTALMETAWQDGEALIDLATVSGDVAAPTQWPWLLEVADQMLDAVESLHSDGWAHGSLVPGKFLVRSAPSGTPQTFLIDPGFARLVGAPEKTTAGGLLMDRLRHSPPERFVGEESSPTAAGDIYTLGLILYELLTGHYPISGDQPTSIAAGHLLRPPLDFAESDPEGRLPGEIRHALLCCLAKAPEARFPDVTQLRAAFASGRAALASDVGPSTTRLAQPIPAPAKSAGPGGSGPDSRSELRRLVDRARQAADRRDYTSARQALRRGLELAPEDARLASLLRDVERAAKEQQRQEKRRRQLDEAAAEIEQLLALGDWRRARSRFATASQQVGSSDRLRGLERRIEDFESRSRAASSPASPAAPRQESPASSPPVSPAPAGAVSRADELVEKARRQSQAESFDSALVTLDKALEMEPEHAAARTLSESVAALAAMHRREGDRQATIESTTRVIREHLDRGDPGRAMAQLNRAVARYGNRSDLQELRFAIADAFLREQVGDAAPYETESSQLEASPGGFDAPSPASSSQASPESQAPDDAGKSARGVDGFQLAGLGSEHEADEPPAEPAPAPRTLVADAGAAPPPVWLDLRRPQAWFLIIALMAAVAFFGHWLAQRQNVEAPALDSPAIETEDVRPTAPG